MSNTMTAHEPIKYLDSILNEEETRCEYSHERRNFTISRSGRFKSKNKKRDTVDRKLFDTTEVSISVSQKDELSRASNTKMDNKDQDKITKCQTGATTSSFKDYKHFQPTHGTTNNRSRDKDNNYKSFYETNL